MFRLRSPLKLALITVAMLSMTAAGCIFSPDKPKDQPCTGPDCGGTVVYPAIINPPTLIENLKLAYQKKDYDKFATLFHPDYQFRLNAPADDGTEYWGLDEELKIHRRMFRPSDIQPPEPALPTELWLSSVDITLTGATGFDDRPQYLYDQFTNPEGLHAEAWDVTGADYNATVFFETQGDTDYRVEGRAEFVVARDKSKAVDAPGAWLIYRWTDLGAAKPSAAPAM